MTEETTGQPEVEVPTETPAVTQETHIESESSTETQQESAKPVEDELIPRKRLDKVVWQREEALRKTLRLEEEIARLKTTQTPKQETVDPTKPNVNDPRFKTYDEYTEALAEWKIETRLKKAQDDHRKRTEVERFNESKRLFDERAAKTREKFPDFDELFENAPISEAMAPAILDSEAGPEIAVYLSKNPDVARKLYNLNPTQAAREIGKIEAKLDSLLPTKTVTEAKPPLKPVRPKGEASDGLSDDVDIKVWMKNRNKQLGRS